MNKMLHRKASEVVICVSPWLNPPLEKKQFIIVPIQRKISKDIYTEYLQQKQSSVKSGKGRFCSDTSISRNSLKTYLTFQIHCLQFSASHIIKLKTIIMSLVCNLSGRQRWPADKSIQLAWLPTLTPGFKVFPKSRSLRISMFHFYRKGMKQTTWIPL